MRRWKLLGTVGLIGLVAGAFVLWLWPERISRRAYDRIQIGMTQGEALDILGLAGDQTMAPEDVTTGETTYEGVAVEDGTSLGWSAGKQGIGVYFDRNGQVVGKNFWRAKTFKQVALDNLARQASRLWPQWFGEEYKQTGYERPIPPMY
jgi:hypothetical protein